MGDRANVVVTEGGDQVCLYTHWAGSELVDTVKAAMKRGQDRWDDYQYLTRIIFCEMIKADVMGLTGFGITSTPKDGDDRIITINCDTQTVRVFDGNEVSFSDFVK